MEKHSTRQPPENSEAAWHNGDRWSIATGFDLEYQYKQALEELQERTGMTESEVIETLVADSLL